jgi:hypothetical protein
MVDVFHNPAKSCPTSDDQIVRVDMEKSDIGGRKSALPAQMKAGEMTINHVPNAGTSIGAK